MSGNELECRSSHHHHHHFYKHKSTIGLLVTEQDILKVSNLVKEVGMERRKNTTYENPYEKLKVIQTNKMKQTNNCPHSEVGQDFLNNLFNNNNLFPSLPRSPLQPYKSYILRKVALSYFFGTLRYFGILCCTLRYF